MRLEIQQIENGFLLLVSVPTGKTQERGLFGERVAERDTTRYFCTTLDVVADRAAKVIRASATETPQGASAEVDR